MAGDPGCSTPSSQGMSLFERYLTVWVALCIIAGIGLGKIAPGLAQALDGMAIYVNDAPVISIPIAVCLFFMMYPIMVKIDFTHVLKSAKTPKPVLLTLFINWAIKPFSMFAISYLFLGYLFRGYLPGTEILANKVIVRVFQTTCTQWFWCYTVLYYN